MSSSSSRRRSRRSSRRGSEGGERPGERGQRDEATLRSIACRRRMRPLCAICSCADVRRRCMARCGSPQGRGRKGQEALAVGDCPSVHVSPETCLRVPTSQVVVSPSFQMRRLLSDPWLQTEAPNLPVRFVKAATTGRTLQDVRRQPNEPWFDGGQAPAGGLKRLGPRAGSPEPQYNRDLPARRE